MIKIVDELRKLLRCEGDIKLLYLFGSRAVGAESPLSDLDLAFLSDDGLEAQLKLIKVVSRALNIPEDRVDVVDLSKAPLHLKFEILRKGVKILDRGHYERELLREVAESYPGLNEDFSIDVRLWLNGGQEVDVHIVLERLDEVLRATSLIRDRYLGKGVDWLLEDLERVYAFERAMHRAIEAMLDICRHIVSAKGLGAPRFYSDYPMRIYEAGLMEKELAERLGDLARLRNILIHRYVELDHVRLLQVAQRLVEEVVPKFRSWVKGTIKKEQD